MTEQYEEYTDDEITEWNEEDAMPWVLGLTDKEVEELRNKKHELTDYGKEQLKKLKEKQDKENTNK